MFEKKENIKLNKNIDEFINPQIAQKELAIFNLTSGVKFKGEITGATEVIIEGSANAKIQTNKLIVGNTGKLKGKITANNVEVEGTIKGTIKVSETLTIYGQGRVSGKIEYYNLDIKLGGNINGDVQFVDKIKKNY